MTTPEEIRDTIRDQTLMIRLTLDEKGRIKAKAHEHLVSISAYCRRRALVVSTPPPGVPPVNAALADELSHTTDKVNQIALSLNSDNDVNADDLKFVLLDLANLVDLLRAELGVHR